MLLDALRWDMCPISRVLFSQSVELHIGPSRDHTQVSDSVRCMLGILLAGKMECIIS